MALIHDTGHFGPLFLGSQSRVSLEDLKPSLVNLVQQACRSLGCYGTPQILTNQLTLSQPEGGRLCSSNYNWHPRIFKPSYGPVQDPLNVIYLSDLKVLLVTSAVTFMCLAVDTSFIFRKKIKVCKMFFGYL